MILELSSWYWDSAYGTGAQLMELKLNSWYWSSTHGTGAQFMVLELKVLNGHWAEFLVADETEIKYS